MLRDIAAEFVRQLSKVVLILIPYSTRLIKVDRVGFEPTTLVCLVCGVACTLLEIQYYKTTQYSCFLGT